jgi:hypothetical protein
MDGTGHLPGGRHNLLREYAQMSIKTSLVPFSRDSVEEGKGNYGWAINRISSSHAIGDDLRSQVDWPIISLRTAL